MRSGVPWHVKGVRPEARDAAREAARRAGMSVSDWLNSIIVDSASEEGVDIGARNQRDYRDDDYRGPQNEYRAPHDDYRPPPDEYRAPQGGYQSSQGDIADAIARLDRRMECMIEEGRAATDTLERKVTAVDQALASLGHERARAVTGDWSGVDQAVAEIASRQRELDSDQLASNEFKPPAPPVGGHAVSSIQDQLRQINDHLDALRPADIAGLRKELAEIGRTLSEASPRRAIEALEGEVCALASRVDAGRKSGADADVLANVERGLAEVRETLGSLTPAENLKDFGAAIEALSHKIDKLASNGPNPAMLEQLEAAIGGLRGIVSHVASAEALATLSGEVRALAAKVNTGIGGGGNGADILKTIDHRIAAIADALEIVRASGGHVGSPNLDATIKALGDKVEKLQGSRGDVVLGNLEERIAKLVDKLDSSEARYGNLDTIERGMAEMLGYLDELRGNQSIGEELPRPPYVERRAAMPGIVRDVWHTQDSVEAAHGTIGDVVDRLAMIEQGIRGPVSETAAAATELPALAQAAPPPAEEPPALAMQAAPTLAIPLPTTPRPGTAEARATRPKKSDTAMPLASAQRAPVDGTLAYDHPLEPGSGPPRPGMVAAAAMQAANAPRPHPASPADRIAASKAAFDPKKDEPQEAGAKTTFVVAARRAAQAAVDQEVKSGQRIGAVTGPESAASFGATLGKHLKSILVGLSVLIILAGMLHFAVNYFDARDPVAEPPKSQLRVGEPTANAAPPGPLSKLTPPLAAAPQPDVAIGMSNNSLMTMTIPMVPSAAVPARPEVVARAPAAPVTVMPPAPEVTGSIVAPRPGPAVAAVPPPASAMRAPKGLPPAIGSKPLIAAADGGDATAAYEVAVRYAEGRGVAVNAEEAAIWFERAARAGLAPAQFRLGGMFEKGIGVAKNLPRARDYYTAAATRGHAKSMHNLAVLYAEGVDGKPDYANAVQWFRKSAGYGVADSQYNLGVLHARGIGVTQNLSELFKWFALAALQGDRDAAQKRDDVAGRLDPPALNAARSAVQNWVNETQPDEATTVKTPPGGWDRPAPAAPRKPKGRAAPSGRSVPI